MGTLIKQLSTGPFKSLSAFIRSPLVAPALRFSTVWRLKCFAVDQSSQNGQNVALGERLRTPMKAKSPHRKVLMIDTERDVRNVIYMLIARLGYEGEVADGVRSALARLAEEHFDAVLLDIRCSGNAAAQVMSQIRDLRPSLVGRVLVITGDIASPEEMDMIERECLPQIRRRDLIKDLAVLLKSLMTQEGSTPNYS